MTSSSETNLKKNASLKQKNAQTMSPVAKNKRLAVIRKQNDSCMLNCLQECIDTCDTESEWESDFSKDISDYDSSDSDLAPLKYFYSTVVSKK